MNILILNRIPYNKIEYHRAIDHYIHNVIYFGDEKINRSIPDRLRAIKITKNDNKNIIDDVCDWVNFEKLNLDHVISLSEYELISAAEIRSRLGIQGKNIEDVLLTRDKVLMKQKIHESGLIVPYFEPVKNFLVNRSVIDDRKLVLKPKLGASSENVICLKNKKDLINYLDKEKITDNELDQYEVEEYINGEILHFDGIVSNGNIQTVLASKYIGTCLDYAQGSPLGSYQIYLNNNYLKWIQKVLRALRITDGAFHLEAIQTDSELYFLEIGNRVGGADVVRTYELATDIHLPSKELEVLLSKNKDSQKYANEELLITNNREKWYGWFVYPGHKSKNIEILKDKNFNILKNSPHILEWNELCEGDKLPSKITYQSTEVPLSGLVGASSPSNLKSYITNLFKKIMILSN